MATDKKNTVRLSVNNLNEWIRSVGILLPENELELKRFDKLYADYEFELSNKIVDTEAIFNNTTCKVIRFESFHIKTTHDDELNQFAMAARKGVKEIPPHILDKIKKQDDSD